ncbi:putative COPII coat assembly protein, Sec16 [Helianthus anomalus]
MASNPPFMVEDTDEDFFDKLVDDDDDDDLNPPALALKEEINNIVDDNDNDSDDAKAFANLSISDVGAGVEDLGEVGLEEDSLLITKEEFSNVTPVDSSRIVSSNSLTVDNNVNDEPDDNGTIQLDKPVGSTGSEDQNQGSGGTAGVKEVQWSSFGSDSVENSDNVFGADPGFFNEFDNGSVDQIGKEDSFISSVVNNSLQVEDVNTYSHQLQSDQAYATTGEQASDGQDPNSIQYWENLYPGWKYDANTGQWYQVDGNYYLQQSAQSVVGAVAEKGTTESITSWDSVSQSGQSLSNWNQGSEANNKVYPPHMVFDPQYPGWYYDMHVQEWRSLDEYNSQSTAVAQEAVNQNGYGSRTSL